MTKLFTRVALTIAAVVAVPRPAAAAAALGGSPASMRHQHGVAVGEDYSFMKTGAQVRALADEGRLEAMAGNADYAMSDVSYPYARPEVRLFVERLAARYHAATGTRLVVTSLVRPEAEQPGNASPLSVHPAGMAVDLRVPAAAADRAWLERTLLALEGEGVLDVTREKRPPHYHVAVFPAAYRAWVDRQPPVPVVAAPAPVPATPAVAPVPAVAVAPVVSVPAVPQTGGVPAALAWMLPVPVLLLGGAAAARRANG